ncbi:uncharacterized protein MELLADRAFT_92752 [Melampsora larici-populina 98AG31]|uniref:Uncharacterized protein n=1 Tax=Melampsora larici-populina (strain 98AG31 / pathotype 3-4-7) TaxID=747676 RepID=F4S2L8_MELLP|nr:uncharacterized protein MELLADRAFT_92752 [Melampsora larici-populina 98AG31]EGG01026.1 hypothetical protein MELLADRAFT_92752 [Melampsora larici-populina 98AG31]
MIYAHQDKEFDLKVGFKSTVISFHINTKLILTGFSFTMITFFLFLLFLLIISS